VKILISADMEGISGIVHWNQVDAKHKEFDRSRKLMTGDVNAAIRGAYEAGAVEVVVSDGHGDGRNVLAEELDGRARLNSGSPSPLSMVQGIDNGVSAAMFVGYHARVGMQNAILDHTWSSSCVADVRVNGLAVGEIGWNAAVCGHFGVPVILITGDQTACAEATELLGTIETAVVKRASGRMAAECLSPEAAQTRICEAAQRAVERLRQAQAPPPLRLETPVHVTVELTTSDMADRAMLLPGVGRPQGRWVEFHAEDAPSAYRAFRAALALAKG
jgi:D-amino peptidase